MSDQPRTKQCTCVRAADAVVYDSRCPVHSAPIPIYDTTMSMTETLIQEARASVHLEPEWCAGECSCPMIRRLADALSTAETREQEREHRCNHCGHRWQGDFPTHECGDCYRQHQLLKKKAADWNAEADKYLAQRDELTVKLAAAEAREQELAKSRDGWTADVHAVHARLIAALERADAAEALTQQLREALEKLVTAAELIASFAVRWEPLTPGDIRELTDAIPKARAALSPRPVGEWTAPAYHLKGESG